MENKKPSQKGRHQKSDHIYELNFTHLQFNSSLSATRGQCSCGEAGGTPRLWCAPVLSPMFYASSGLQGSVSLPELLLPECFPSSLSVLNANACVTEGPMPHPHGDNSCTRRESRCSCLFYCIRITPFSLCVPFCRWEFWRCPKSFFLLLDFFISGSFLNSFHIFILKFSCNMHYFSYYVFVLIVRSLIKSSKMSHW